MWNLRVGPVDDDLTLRNGNEVRIAVAAVLVADGRTALAAQILAADAWSTVGSDGDPWTVFLRGGQEMKVEAA